MPMVDDRMKRQVIGQGHEDMSKIKFTVPGIPPSLNKFAGRKNCWEYRELKNQWTMLIKFSAPKIKQPIEKATVTITYFFPTRVRHDPDNYSGKMILDGLTAAGIIKDDSFDCVELVLKGEYDKKNPRVEIEVEG